MLCPIHKLPRCRIQSTTAALHAEPIGFIEAPTVELDREHKSLRVEERAAEGLLERREGARSMRSFEAEK